MQPLSPKQLEVFDFIRRFIEQRGFPPTRGEIAEGLGLKNRQGIDQHLRALESKAVLELVPGISRGIRLAAQKRPTISKSTVSEPQFSSRTTRPFLLPLLGRIAAGSPILASENIEEEVEVDSTMFRPSADFLLRVRGDSMKDANIVDRDLLAVHRVNEARNGQIVVARIGEEATVKFFFKEGHRIRLEPANTNYQPIDIDVRKQEFVIEGLAVGVIRRELNIEARR